MHQLQKIDNDYLDTTYKDYLIMSAHVRRTGWYINLIDSLLQKSICSLWKWKRPTVYIYIYILIIGTVSSQRLLPEPVETGLWAIWAEHAPYTSVQNSQEGIECVN